MARLTYPRGLALLLIVLLSAAVVASYATKGFVYDQAHYHVSSPTTADNGQDDSYLDTGVNTGRDGILMICDHSANGYEARGRAFNRGKIIGVYADGNGALPGCAFLGLDGGAGGASGHDACVGRRNGALFGCGPNSGHGI